MQVSHAFSAEFDDDNLIGTAGPIPIMNLAESAGLTGLVREHISVAGSAGSNADVKVPAVLAGMMRVPTASPIWTCCAMAGWAGPSPKVGHRRRWARTCGLYPRAQPPVGRGGLAAAD